MVFNISSARWRFINAPFVSYLALIRLSSSSGSVLTHAEINSDNPSFYPQRFRLASPRLRANDLSRQHMYATDAGRIFVCFPADCDRFSAFGAAAAAHAGDEPPPDAHAC